MRLHIGIVVAVVAVVIIITVVATKNYEKKKLAEAGITPPEG